MKLSFHTNAFVWAGQNDLLSIAKFAKEAGFDSLEVGPGIELDYDTFNKARELVDYSAFIFCRNFIDDDKEVAENFKNELFKRMEFAASLGVKKIVTSTGISKSLSLGEHGLDPEKSLDKASAFLNELVERAEKLNMYVALENCPMQRNIATSPYMWDKIFDRIQSERLGICYDPGHFVWEQIDVYKPLIEYKNKILHLHIKDTEIFEDRLSREGIMHNTGSDKGFNNTQWWRHTIIEDGLIDWNLFFTEAKNLPSPLVDYSVEMEDYKFEGNEESIKNGLKIQWDRIQKYIHCEKI